MQSEPEIFRGLAARKNAAHLRLARFPWWMMVILLVALWTGYTVITRTTFREAFTFIINGIGVTIGVSIAGYALAIALGLIAGLGRLSRNVVINNLATLYVEMVRGIPMLVLIFFIALVAVPGVVEGLNGLSAPLRSLGLTSLANTFEGMNVQDISMTARAIIALAITYGAFQAEIFRAGIQSIGRGQMEAARSLGMTYGQAMWYVVLPQAIRNVLPALGNDFIAMVKDTSLVSVLAVRDITQVARLYAGRSFRFPEAYTTLAVLYLIITILLSLVVKLIEKRTQIEER